MRAEVFHNADPVGTIDWTPDAHGVQVNLDCAVCGDELLRCYAVFQGNVLRVGLPAPEHGTDQQMRFSASVLFQPFLKGKQWLIRLREEHFLCTSHITVFQVSLRDTMPDQIYPHFSLSPSPQTTR